MHAHTTKPLASTMRGALGAAGQCTLRQMQHAAAHVSTQAKAAAASVARGCGAAPSIIASPRGWAAPRPVVIRATARKIPHPNATAAAVARPVPPRCRLLRSRTRQALSVTEPEPRCLLPHSSAGSVTHRTRRTLTRQAGATTSLSATRPPGWDINVHERNNGARPEPVLELCLSLSHKRALPLTSQKLFHGCPVLCQRRCNRHGGAATG